MRAIQIAGCVVVLALLKVVPLCIMRYPDLTTDPTVISYAHKPKREVPMRIEAQHIKTGQKFNGSAVRAIHKLLLFGKPAVRLFCEDGSVVTLSGTAKIRIA